MKIYYIITEFALSNTDEMHFLIYFLFIKTTEKNDPINCLPAKIFNLP